MIFKVFLIFFIYGLRTLSKADQEDQMHIITKFMNKSVDPCDDFYEYSCGNWASYNLVPPSRYRYSELERISDNLASTIRDLLQIEGDFQEISNDPEIKAKKMYAACMNQELIENRKNQPLLDYLNSIGGWSVLNQNSTNPTWAELVGQSRLIESRIIIDFYVYLNPRNTTENIIFIEEPDDWSPLNRAYFLDEKFSDKLNLYKEYMKLILELLGVDHSKLNETVASIVEFEIELAKIRTKDSETFDDRYNRVTLEEVYNLFPEIEWQSAFKIIHGRKIDMKEEMLLMGKRYIERLIPLLKKTNSETVCSYIFWRIIADSVQLLDSRFQEGYLQFQRSLSGVQVQKPIWMKCANMVNHRMKMAVASLYVKKYFKQEIVSDLNGISTEILSGYRENFNNRSWHDEGTIKNITKKIDNIKITVGFPNYIWSLKKLTNKYTELDIDVRTHFENVINSFHLEAREQQRSLGKDVDKFLWERPPVSIESLFNNLLNHITIGAGLLQTPYYESDFPHFRKYGAMGTVIAQLVSYGFDRFAQMFNQDGNMFPWWNIEDIRDLKNRSLCYLDQYKNYKFEGKQFPIGEFFRPTTAENVALKHSFLAYTNWLRKQKIMSENKELTNQQLFFISYAQAHCFSYNPKAVDEILNGAIPPQNIRVNGAISNSKGFAMAYNCKPDAPMNPTNKCELW